MDQNMGYMELEFYKKRITSLSQHAGRYIVGRIG